MVSLLTSPQARKRELTFTRVRHIVTRNSLSVSQPVSQQSIHRYSYITTRAAIHCKTHATSYVDQEPDHHLICPIAGCLLTASRRVMYLFLVGLRSQKHTSKRGQGLPRDVRKNAKRLREVNQNDRITDVIKGKIITHGFGLTPQDKPKRPPVDARGSAKRHREVNKNDRKTNVIKWKIITHCFEQTLGPQGPPK